MVGCPSGCPIETVHRESLSFDRDISTPYILVVWDGDRFNKIPVLEPSNSGHLLTLTTEAVVSLVEEFLMGQGVHLGGLSLRIHSRNPEAE